MARVKKTPVKQQYSAAEAAEIMGLCKQTVYRMIDAGSLQAKRIGTRRDYRISRASIENYLGEPIAAPVIEIEDEAPAAPSAATMYKPTDDFIARLRAKIEELHEFLQDKPLSFLQDKPEAQEGQDKPGETEGSLADVFSALDALRAALERAMANPHYSHVKNKIGSVMQSLEAANQELTKAELIADDLRKAYLGR